MKKLIYLVTVFIFLIHVTIQAGQIRTLELSSRSIGTIRLARDHATLIEVPTKNFKLVAGAPELLEIAYNQDSFLLKPKASDFKTNLFVLTNIGRFNLHIQEVSSLQNADEVVTLRFKSNPTHECVKPKGRVPKEKTNELKSRN